MRVITKIGTSKNHILIAHLLAKMVYKNQDVSPLKTYIEYFNKSPESFIFAHDKKTGNLVGYIIALPLTPEYFKKTLEEDFKEQDLTKEVIRPYQKGNNYIYLFSIVIDPTYQYRVTTLHELSKTMMNQLKQMAIEGKYVIEASALALSESGKKLCKGLNMAQLGENEKGTVFFNDKFHKLFINDKNESNKAIKEEVLQNFSKHRENILKNLVRNKQKQEQT